MKEERIEVLCAWCRQPVLVAEAHIAELVREKQMHENHASRLQARLKEAQELIEEVHSQCPEENDWFKQAGNWLGRKK